MSSNCYDLLLEATLLNNTNSRFNLSGILNLSDNVVGEILLNEDKSSILDAKYWKYSDLYIGLIILILTGFIISVFTVYCYYPYYDKKQKLIKLTVELGLETPILQKDIIPHLNRFCDGNQDVIQLIFEFADITLKHDNIMQYMDSIMISTFNKQSIFHQLCTIIAAWNLLLLSYFPIYFISVHISESYRSYVEVKCVPIQLESDDDLFSLYQTSVFALDLNELCGDILNDYVIYAEFYRQGTYIGDQPCFVNKENLMNFRGNMECYGCGWLCKNTGRCGVCGDGCCKCCASNVCAYIWCLIFAIIILFIWFTYMMAAICPRCACGNYGVCSFYDIKVLETAITLTSISGNM